MRRLWQKKIAVLFALLFLAVEMLPPATAYAYTADSPGTAKAGMELIAQTDEAELYLDRKTTQLCLVDRSSQIAVYTKIVDGDSGNAEIKANQKSDFIISYYKNSKSAAPMTQANYTMAIDAGQMEFAEIENGVRITYTLKKDKLTLECVPKYISEERMQSLVLDYITTSEERTFFDSYYRLYEGRYVRTKDGGSTQSAIRQIYSLFYETGKYTEEDLIADNEENDYESEWDNLEIQATLEYVLDRGDLVVRMPMDGIVTNDSRVIVSSVTLLPYFLSATQEEEGYFLFPEGSGAVVNFNNGKVFATDYSSRVYGKDVLLDRELVPVAEYYANMPLIGAVYKDYAIMAIVEKGEGMAEISAKISGKSDNYNNAYFRFHIHDMENVATSNSSTVMVNKFTGDTLSGNVEIRYKLLTDPSEANYSGMAHAYREYLIEKGVLSPLQEHKAELYLELLGSTLESKTMLGFPYRGVKELTSFKDAKAIIEDLKNRGVDNAIVQLDGWLDGGQRHEKLTKVKLEGSQGNKSSFNSLAETAKNLGYGLYPDVAMQYIYPSFDAFQGGDAESYAKKYGSRYLSNEYAWQTELAYAGFTSKFSMIWSPFILSPANLASYTQKAVKGLSKFDITGLTVTDMGTQLVSDYNEKAQVSRDTAIGKVGESMDILEESFDLIMKAPYQYAWEGVTRMSDLPSRSTEFTIFDYDVPFLQLVLDGCVTYSTEPLNYQPQKDMSELLLRCIETRSNPKFYVMDADMDELKYSLYADYASINYGQWADRIAETYKEYKAFADKVADSNIALHETLAEKLVKVTYENGVTVYVNYGDKAVSVEGRELAARSYLLAE